MDENRKMRLIELGAYALLKLAGRNDTADDLVERMIATPKENIERARLKKYLQWVYVPAVKDAAAEQEEGKSTALGQLLQRTVRTKVDFQEPINKRRQDLASQYQAIIQKEQNILDGLSR